MARWLAYLALCSATASAAPAAGDWQTVDRIVAVVDDDIVLARELDRRVAAFAAEVARIPDPAERTRRQTGLREAVLQALVDELLIAHAAANANITLEEADIDRALAAVKAQYGLDDPTFARALADNGMTLPEYRQELRRQLLRMKTLTILVGPRIDVSETRTRAAYAAEKERNPTLGDYDSQAERLRASLYDQDMTAEADKWLAWLRKNAHVELRP